MTVGSGFRVNVRTVVDFSDSSCVRLLITESLSGITAGSPMVKTPIN